MTKIDSNRLPQDLDTARADAAQKLANDTKVAKKSDQPTISTDTVQVSSDAKLFAAATKAASEPAPVRADVVEAMKQKLAAGELGQDSARLADRIIDDLLKE